MRRRIVATVIFLCVTAVTPAQTILPVIPQPVSIKLTGENFLLTRNTVIVSDVSSQADAEIFNSEMEEIVGFKLPILNSILHSGEATFIYLSSGKNKTFAKDGYDLTIKKNEIRSYRVESLMSGDF